MVGGADSSPYYVFNAADNNGFVIVAGDDRSPRILGYSDKGEFNSENMPPQLKALLARYSEKLSEKADVRHSSWSKAPARMSENGVLLPTANWGQGYPYNTDCPLIDGEHALTGCVATAMAIVMKYHNWPEGYNWDEMPMNTEEDPINYEENNDLPALAKIMHDAGEAVFMEYSLEESGAYLDWIGHRLQSVFHYSPDCQYLGGDHFETEEWVKMLRENLDKGNPVIYDGYGSGGHHAFIIDGYNSSDLYHVNWGWDGMYNGFYALDALDPMEGSGFSEYNGMIMNIEPDYELGEYSECFTDYGYLWAMGTTRRAAVMNFSIENIEKGVPFNFFNSRLTVTPGFKGQIGLAIVDKDNNIKEVIYNEYRNTIDPISGDATPVCVAMQCHNLVATCDIEPTDRLQFVSKHDDDDNYKLILGTLEWPSSKSVVGNTPEIGKVIFNIGEGVRCSFREDGKDFESVEAPVGITEISALYGAVYSIFFGKEDEMSDQLLNLAIHGNLFGGTDEYWTGRDPVTYPLEIFGDKYEVEIKLLDLKDENIHLDTAGTLKDKLADGEGINIGSLTISGKMNALDFWYIRDNCPSVQLLDLKDVEIEEITAGDGAWVPDYLTHQANTIPYRALPGLVNLEKIILPESLTAIDGFSLMSTKIESISIPAGVKSIGRDAFWGNESLMVVEVLNPEPPVLDYTPFDQTPCPANGILFVPEGSAEKYKDAEVWKDFSKIIEGTMPDLLKTTITVDNLTYECFINEAKLIGYQGEPADVVIPGTITDGKNAYTVKSIKEECFSNCSTLESVLMPNTITSIGYNCFMFCRNLKKVELSDKITEIPYNAFYLCERLEDIEIGRNITSIGASAFQWAGIRKMYIPKTLLPDPYSSAFGGNVNLEKFEVEEGHEYYTAIDGLLYRKGQDGLMLECVPGGKAGVITISPECNEVMESSITGCPDISDIIFNERLNIIDRWAVGSNTSLKHISIPASVRIMENAFRNNYALESVTLNGVVNANAGIFEDCPNLKHIYIDAEEEVNLDGLFVDEYENLNFFNPSMEKKFAYSGNHTIFIPGASQDQLGVGHQANVLEMWEYMIDRNNNRIAVVPAMEGLAIDKVTINGRVVTPENNIYDTVDKAAEVNMLSDMDSKADLDVRIEYTLHGRQSMNTHYTPEFNATIQDSVITGIRDLSAEESDMVDVYGIDGTLLIKHGYKTDIQLLAPGIYIIKEGAKSTKTVIID